jgi:hypothetical protein
VGVHDLDDHRDEGRPLAPTRQRERPEEYPLEYPTLIEAGELGWELVGAMATGGKNELVLYFKRPKAEG